MRIFVRTKGLLIRIKINARRYSNRAPGGGGDIYKCPFFGKSSKPRSAQPTIRAPASCPITSAKSKIIRPTKKGMHQTTKSSFCAASDILGHPLYPKRDGLDESEFEGGITWRHDEEFDYSHLNKKYLTERIGKWNDPSSAEQLVSNLVKTLEMELRTTNFIATTHHKRMYID